MIDLEDPRFGVFGFGNIKSSDYLFDVKQILNRIDDKQAAGSLVAADIAGFTHHRSHYFGHLAWTVAL